MPTRDIRTRLAIDGEREYKQSLESINAGLKTLNTEMKAVSSQYADNSDSIEALKAKNDLIVKQYEEQVKKLEILEQAHQNAINQVGEEDKRTQSWAQSVNIAKARLAELERQMGDVAREVDPVNRAIRKNEEAAKGATTRIGYLNSELRALDAQYANNRQSTEYLTKRQEILDRQYQESVNRVQALQAALKHIEMQSGRNSDEYRRMEASLNDARAEMYSAESATKDLQSEGKGLGDTISEIASKFGIQLPNGVQDALNGFIKFDAKVEATGSSAKGSMSGIIESIGGKAGVVGAALGAAAAIVEIGKKAAEAAVEVEESSDRMKIALGLTKEESEEARFAVLAVYQKGLVETKDEAESAVTAVMRVMGATGREAVDLADKLVLINKVFGQDYAESARTASTLMNTFGISGSEALDIIVTGLQTTANKNGDLLDVLNEYSPSFERLGNDAETFLARVVAATDAGAFSADKAADAYKEFYNKAAGQDATFIEAIEALNLKSETIIRDLLSGGDAARDAMGVVIDSLDNVADESKQAQLAAKLFGSQWEDVGTKAILAMNSLEGGVMDTKDAASRGLEELLDNFGNQWNQFWRALDPELRQKIIDFGWEHADAVIDGYVKGLEDNKKKAIDATEDAAKDIDKASRGVLDINSPSGTFEEQGELSMDGYVIGIKRRLAQARREVQASMTLISDSVRQSSAGGVMVSGSAYGVQAGYAGGDVFHISIDAKSVKEFNDIVRIAQGARQQRRAKGGR